MSETTVPATPPTPAPEASERPEAISALEYEPDALVDENDIDDPDGQLAQEFFATQEPPAPAVDPAVTPPVPGASDPAPTTPPAPAATQPPPAAAPVDPVVPAAAATPTETPAAPTPSVQTDPQAQAPQASAPNAPEEAFRVLSDAITRERPAIIDAVAAGQYRLTDDELTQVATEPEKVLPQLMARVHVNAVQGVLTHVAQQLPAVVGGMIRAHQQQADLETKFYSAWPQLNRSQHDGTVRHLAATYRQMHPNATFEEITRVVGAQAAFAHGLTPQGGTPAAPAAAPARQVPFQPAAAARTAAAPTRTEPGTWERMASIIAADDAGIINSE